MQLSQNEYLIMQLLWREGRPLSRADLLNGTTGRNWNPASIHLILNSMLSKGAIKITDEEKKYGRTYEATISQSEFILKCIDEGMPGWTQEEKTLSIMSAVLNRQDISEKELDLLEDILAKRRKQICSKKKS